MQSYKELLNIQKKPNSLNITINIPLNNDENLMDIVEGFKRKVLNLSHSKRRNIPTAHLEIVMSKTINENMNESGVNIEQEISHEKTTKQSHPERSNLENMDKSINATKVSHIDLTETSANTCKNTNDAYRTNLYKDSLCCNDNMLEMKLVKKKRKKEKMNGQLNTYFIDNFNNLEIHCKNRTVEKHGILEPTLLNEIESDQCYDTNESIQKLNQSSTPKNNNSNIFHEEDEMVDNYSTFLQDKDENLVKQENLTVSSFELSNQIRYPLNSTLNSEQGNTCIESHYEAENQEKLFYSTPSNKRLMENTNVMIEKQVNNGEYFKSKKKRKHRSTSDNSTESIQNKPICSSQKENHQNLPDEIKSKDNSTNNLNNIIPVTNNNDIKGMTVHETSNNAVNGNSSLDYNTDTHLYKQKQNKTVLTEENINQKNEKLLETLSKNTNSLENMLDHEMSLKKISCKNTHASESNCGVQKKQISDIKSADSYTNTRIEHKTREEESDKYAKLKKKKTITMDKSYINTNQIFSCSRETSTYYCSETTNSYEVVNDSDDQTKYSSLQENNKRMKTTTNTILSKEGITSSKPKEVLSEHINENNTVKGKHQHSKVRLEDIYADNKFNVSYKGDIDSDNVDKGKKTSKIDFTCSNLGMEEDIVNCSNKHNDDNKKRQLKHLYNQASKQYKRLKIINELPNVETDHFNDTHKSTKHTKRSIEIFNPKESYASNTCNLNVVNDQPIDIINSSVSEEKTLDILDKKADNSDTEDRDHSFSKNTLQSENELYRISHSSLFQKNETLKKSDKINGIRHTSVHNNINFIGKNTDITIDNDVSAKLEIIPKHSNNKTTLLCEDSSDDEEKDLSDIMNYLKKHAETNLFKPNELKLSQPANTNHKKKIISKITEIDVNLSKSDSSDSSLDAHVLTLKSTRNEKGSISKKKKKSVTIKKEKSNRSENKTSEAVKSPETKLDTTANSRSKKKPSLKAKLVDLDSSLNSNKDCFTAENTAQFEFHKHSRNIQEEEMFSKVKDSKQHNTKQYTVKTGGKKSNQAKDINVEPTKTSETNIEMNANQGCKKKSPLKVKLLDSDSSNCSRDSFTNEYTSEIEFNKNSHDIQKRKMFSENKESKHERKQNTLLNFLNQSAIDTTRSTIPKENSNINNEIKRETSKHKTLNLDADYGLHTKTKHIKIENNSPDKIQTNMTKITNKQIVLDYFDNLVSKRYENKQPAVRYNSKEYISDSEDEVKVTKAAISEFETDKDSDQECKTKMLEIMSYAEDELLNTFEENEQLADLKINITWDIPISHTIETRISSCPTKEQQKLFKELNIKLRNGPFTMVEDKLIKNNFKDFCLKHGLNYDPTPFLNLLYGTTSILKTKERLKFARYLGRGLESRKLYSIYSRFKVLHSTMKKGRFRPEEDAVIMEYMKLLKNSSKQFSSLSKILNRPRSAIEKRYKVIQQQFRSIKPKDYIVFIKTLIEVTACNNLNELKNKQISDKEWAEVAKILNFQKRNLQVCWMASLYTKLFNKGPINVDDIMRKLIEKLYEDEEDDYRKLNWAKLALPFKNVTGSFLYRLFKKTREAIVPLHLHQNLRKTILAMKEVYGENKRVMPQIKNIVIKL